MPLAVNIIHDSRSARGWPAAVGMNLPVFAPR